MSTKEKDPNAVALGSKKTEKKSKSSSINLAKARAAKQAMRSNKHVN